MSEITGNILKNFSFITILIELSKGQKMTGYEIMKCIDSFGFKSHSGSVYPQLYMLEDWGLIRGKEQKTRSRFARRGATAYEITEKAAPQAKTITPYNWVFQVLDRYCHRA